MDCHVPNLERLSFFFFFFSILKFRRECGAYLEGRREGGPGGGGVGAVL